MQGNMMYWFDYVMYAIIADFHSIIVNE